MRIIHFRNNPYVLIEPSFWESYTGSTLKISFGIFLFETDLSPRTSTYNIVWDAEADNNPSYTPKDNETALLKSILQPLYEDYAVKGVFDRLFANTEEIQIQFNENYRKENRQEVFEAIMALVKEKVATLQGRQVQEI